VANLLGLAVLSYLRQRPMHPYELSRTLKENGDERSIKYNHGSLYMVVSQLAKAGFITAQETEREGQRPERTVYALTEAGQAELREWLRELLAEPRFEFPSYVAALSLVAALPPSEVVPLLRVRADALAEQVTQIRATVARFLGEGVPEVFLIEEEYRADMAEAELAFTRRFIDNITDHPDWGRVWREFHEETS
jgi:DNA-binding PadR family transcriptional regulator